jgi:ribosomal protein S18 acetylase RimI-like enzyme
MKIRKATQADIESIMKLWKELMNFHIERDSYFDIANNAPEKFAKFIKEKLDSNDYCILVAEDNGRVVGYCLAKKDKHPLFKAPDYSEIFDLVITREFRRKGIGSALLDKVFNWCFEKGIKRVEVKVALANEVSRKFWRKMGFKPCMEILYVDK